MPAPKIAGQKKDAQEVYIGPGPGSYEPQSPKTLQGKLGKFSKEERKGNFDKKNTTNYNYKKITKAKLSDI